jgi:uncharacterized membrane protein YqhA
MVKSNSFRDILGTLGQGLFIWIPLFVILIILISWIFGIIYSVRILFDLVIGLSTAQDKFTFIVALASIIEFGLFVAMAYIITLGLYSSILRPFTTKKTEEPLQLGHIHSDFSKKVSTPFLSIVISILVIYILEIATGILVLVAETHIQNCNDIYCKIGAIISLAIVAVIISIIMRLEK